MIRRFARIDRTRLGIGLGLIIIGFGILGALYIRDAEYVNGGWVGGIEIFGRQIRGFNLDGEMNLPTAFSGLLLVTACLVGLVVATESASVGISAARLVPIVALIGFMSLDEVWQIHERLESWTGIDWQTLYLPVFAIAGVLGATLLPRLRNAGHAAHFLVLGGVAWAMAQIFEALQWDGTDRLTAPWTIVPEETLEMAGSLLFMLAFLALASHIVAARDAGAAARFRNRAISAGVRPRAGVLREPARRSRPRSRARH